MIRAAPWPKRRGIGHTPAFGARVFPDIGPGRIAHDCVKRPTLNGSRQLIAKGVGFKQGDIDQSMEFEIANVGDRLFIEFECREIKAEGGNTQRGRLMSIPKSWV